VFKVHVSVRHLVLKLRNLTPMCTELCTGIMKLD
jgi:hypothetical protein